MGKALRSTMRLRGGGSALPGLFVERISPNFVHDTLAHLPLGTVLISGTNGKTTTTKMVVSLLESQGLKVFTNRTGSNFVRGVAAALLGDIDHRGKLDADIAVLELDEAHAVKFAETIKPRYSLFLNVMRDQLDRFGEIDTTARMLENVALATSQAVVLNREDDRIASIAKVLPVSTEVRYFGLDTSLLSQFPSDDDLHASGTSPHRQSNHHTQEADVILKSFQDTSATFAIGGKQAKSFTANLKLRGVYNIYNSAAALTLVRTVLPDAPLGSLLTALTAVTPAFGRGETLIVGGQPLELILVKNPSGFRLALDSFSPTGYETMIAINDNYADGRDMSWLWDVDFSSLRQQAVAISGIRAYDMALRLQYEEVPVASVEPRLTKALRDFITNNIASPKRIYCTYTAMLAIRKELSKITDVEVVA